MPNLKELDLNAKVGFTVISCTPVIIDKETEVTISGLYLSKVTLAFVQIGDEQIPLDVKAQSDSNIVISLKKLTRSNISFMVVLYSENDGWYPVGPLLKK